MSTDARERDADPLALIADRDEDTRILYTDFLGFHHWHAIGAAGGPEALAMAIARRPDVVVSETDLPGFDGVTLSDLLRKDWSTAHIPIVFVTSDATKANLARAAAAGADAVLTKPCLPEDLLAALQSAIQHSHNLRDRAAAARATSRAQVRRAEEMMERIGRRTAASALNKAFRSGATVLPPLAPPPLSCPACGGALKHLRSHVGGVNPRHAEQWDYFACQNNCGTFEYRARTKKIKRVD